MSGSPRLLSHTVVALALALGLMLMGTAVQAHGDEDHSKDAPKPAEIGRASCRERVCSTV